MAPLNLRPSMDHRWPLHHRTVPAGWQPSTILIARRAETEAVWNPVTNQVTGGQLELVYWGQARVQPNKDWRARRRNGENSPLVQHAVRIQAPQDLCPQTEVGDLVGVFESPYDSGLEEYVFHIRNPLESSNSWGRSFLGDIDLTNNLATWTQMVDLAKAQGWTPDG